MTNVMAIQNAYVTAPLFKMDHALYGFSGRVVWDQNPQRSNKTGCGFDSCGWQLEGFSINNFFTSEQCLFSMGIPPTWPHQLLPVAVSTY